MTWEEAGRFCSEVEGLRLPSEAEWEYACRAGRQNRWSFGDDEKLLAEHAWFAANAGYQPHPVGRKLPNEWGLYDMHGNVDEWCWDAWSGYSAEPQVDPVGPSDGDARLLQVVSRSSAVVRGGSYWGTSGYLRSTFRFRFKPVCRAWIIGFRCVRGPRRQP